ncbi:MAG: hypothetical protein ACYCQI_14370 [Gammaproteobacteria bacterium]
MPNSRDIINKKTELRKKADKYYKAIEFAYYTLNPSYPMNVPAGNVGESSEPCHAFDYDLARAYYRFLRNDMDVKEINDLIEYFSHPFCSESDYRRKCKSQESKDQEQQEYYVISDEWLESLQDFFKHLLEYKSMLDSFKNSRTGNEIDYRAVLEKHALRFLKEGFTPEMVIEASEKALADREEHKLEQPFAITLERVVKLDDEFIGSCRRSIAFRSGPNGFEEIPEQDDQKVSRLTDLFEELTKKEIEDFRATFVGIHYQKTLSEDRGKLFSRHSDHQLLFAGDEMTHRDRFKAVLEDVCRRRVLS